ncbi:hypothetical protein OH77DRAFT_535311 [Trametes cingulata]|nr:hypothetical protein OH77DRAFT_535311 [Trametes cingulata]
MHASSVAEADAVSTSPSCSEADSSRAIHEDVKEVKKGKVTRRKETDSKQRNVDRQATRRKVNEMRVRDNVHWIRSETNCT